MPRAIGMALVAIGLGLAAGCVFGVTTSTPEPPPGSYSAATFEVVAADKTMSVSGASITEEFLSATKLRPLLGRAFVAEDHQASGTRVVMLGYDFWQRTFGGAPDIIGRVIRIDGRETTVVGIMPKGFAFPKGADLWVPKLPS